MFSGGACGVISGCVRGVLCGSGCVRGVLCGSGCIGILTSTGGAFGMGCFLFFL